MVYSTVACNYLVSSLVKEEDDLLAVVVAGGERSLEAEGRSRGGG